MKPVTVISVRPILVTKSDQYIEWQTFSDVKANPVAIFSVPKQ